MPSESPYRILLASLLLLVVGHRAWFLRKLPKAVAKPTSREAHRLGRILVTLLGLAAVLAILTFLARPTLLSFAALSLPTWLRWTGAGTGLAGLLLLHASQRALGDNWSVSPRVGERHELIRAGPYRWIRHPIYSALLIVQVSALLIASNWALGVPCLGATVLDVLRRAKREEDLLQTRFGAAYRAYSVVTGRFLPRFRPPRA